MDCWDLALATFYRWDAELKRQETAYGDSGMGIELDVDNSAGLIDSITDSIGSQVA